MFIESVTSYLDAWDELQHRHGTALEQISSALVDADPDGRFSAQTDSLLDDEAWLSGFSRHVHLALRQKGWERKSLGRGKHFKSLEHTLGSVGLSLFFGKLPFLLQSMFTRYPPFIRSTEIGMIILLVPMKSVTRSVSGKVASFQRVSNLLDEVSAETLGYPFVILGFSGKETQTPKVQKLGNPLDDFLIQKLGMTFDEMALLGEKPEYDFKLLLPDNRKIAHEVCGMANHPGGGLLLFGVSDDGDLVGIPSDELDEYQLRITSVIRTSCEPAPRFNFEIFPADSDSSRSILVLAVHEIELKPCMTSGRTYIRSGPSVRIAKPYEVRKMVLSG